jgi:hypothetical protein
VTGGQGELNSEELHNLYSLQDIRMIRSRTMRQAGHGDEMYAKFRF